MRVFQKGFNYSQDGYGNRLVYHLQGCNMICPWCSNPEGMKWDGVLVTDREWLIDAICPYHAVHEGKLDRSICENCSTRDCITRHRTKGIRLSYEEISVADIVGQVMESSPMFYDGGGVTFTGGEATLQFQELKECISILKDKGIHTAIETNGTHPRLKELFPLTDQLIIDCKLYEGKRHEEITGISNNIILENIRAAAEEHSCVHIRIPLIGGVNDSEADRKSFLTFFQTLKKDKVTYEVLRYHEFGKKKWEDCGWDYKMADQARVGEDIVKAFREELKTKGLAYRAT